MSTSLEQDDWFTCPICGEVVDADALACPHCGADDETGWSEDAEYDGVDLPAADESSDDVAPARSSRILTVGFVFVVTALVFTLTFCSHG